MLITEASAREAVVTRDSVAFCVGDAKDRVSLVKDLATLAEREALERVSRAEAENAVALASTCDDAEGLVWKISLLEDELTAEHRALEVSQRERQAQFEELCGPEALS
jgi:hypothetical protein